MAMFTQLEKLDFTGKTVKTVITHEGSGLGTSMKDVKKLCKGADIQKGLAIHGAEVKDSKSNVERWIQDVLLMVKEVLFGVGEENPYGFICNNKEENILIWY